MGLTEEQKEIQAVIKARIPRWTRGKPNIGWEITPRNSENVERQWDIQLKKHLDYIKTDIDTRDPLKKLFDETVCKLPDPFLESENYLREDNTKTKRKSKPKIKAKTAGTGRSISRKLSSGSSKVTSPDIEESKKISQHIKLEADYDDFTDKHTLHEPRQKLFADHQHTESEDIDDGIEHMMVTAKTHADKKAGLSKQSSFTQIANDEHVRIDFSDKQFKDDIYIMYQKYIDLQNELSNRDPIKYCSLHEIDKHDLKEVYHVMRLWFESMHIKPRHMEEFLLKRKRSSKKNSTREFARKLEKYFSVECAKKQAFDLRGMYTDTPNTLPKWFIKLFEKGSICLKLVPTFPKNLHGASQEYSDLADALIDVKVAPQEQLTERSRPMKCVVSVTEVVSDRQTRDPPWRRPLRYLATVNDCHSKRVIWREIVTEEPQIQKGNKPVQICMLSFFGLDKYGTVIGTYSRKMFTENKCLSWKFACKQ